MDYMFSKRGQELSIGTLVLIVIGVIVLVLLVLGFSMGWSNLFAKIGIYQGGDVASVATACELATSSQSKDAYCECKTVKLEGGKTCKVHCESVNVKPLVSNKMEEGTCKSINCAPACS